MVRDRRLTGKGFSPIAARLTGKRFLSFPAHRNLAVVNPSSAGREATMDTAQVFAGGLVRRRARLGPASWLGGPTNVRAPSAALAGAAMRYPLEVGYGDIISANNLERRL